MLLLKRKVHIFRDCRAFTHADGIRQPAPLPPDDFESLEHFLPRTKYSTALHSERLLVDQHYFLHDMPSKSSVYLCSLS